MLVPLSIAHGHVIQCHFMERVQAQLYVVYVLVQRVAPWRGNPAAKLQQTHAAGGRSR